LLQCTANVADGSKRELPHRSIAVRFRPNKQTPTTGSMRRYVPEPALSRCGKNPLSKGGLIST
jgi:hypothetical protein